MKRTATAQWKGDGMTGAGTLNTPSGVFKDQPYSFKTRFENSDGKLGTNPEELIAAAHAGCFSMALTFALGKAGFKAQSIDTLAEIDFQKVDEKFTFVGIHLNLKANVPEISKEKFKEIATQAKEGCPVSRALASVKITLDAELV